MPIQKRSLVTLSNDALCRLRDEIAEILDSRAEELRRELKRLTGDPASDAGPTNGKEKTRTSKCHKLAPKFQGPNGKTWCGRGARPQWLIDELKNGKTLEDLLIPNRAKSSASLPNSDISA